MKNRTEIIEALVARQTVAFVGSVDGEGFPNTKAMLAPRVREGLKVFYFTTNTSSMRAAQFRRDPQASVYFCDPISFQGFMLRGSMEVLEDAASRRLIWRDGTRSITPAAWTIRTIAYSASRPATAVTMRTIIRKASRSVSRWLGWGRADGSTSLRPADSAGKRCPSVSVAGRSEG